ncbi:histone-lysine N-methyltransferase PRDM9-like [Lineus longissimus]|uniref:histone-lysine N-methyltransferase PRDM9-like n=1 Tax=Lineus longissimus TaxID=88925 RepID=UPI00315CC183
MDIEIPPLEEIDVDQYFSKEELATIGDYEKLRYKNMVRNYLTMLYFGLPVAKPEFMSGPRRRMKVMMPVDSDSDEEDWTPSLARKKEKEKLPPAPFKFVPPKKPIFVKKKVKEVDKTKPVAGEKKSRKPQKGKKSAKECPATVSRPPDELAVKNMIMRAAAPASQQPVRKKRKVAAADGAARYPRRSLERKNYRELEVPDEDIFLFCEDCQKEYPGDCPVHGPLTIIKDKEVPPSRRSDPDHARKTTPDGLVIEPSKIPGAGLGVISNIAIPEGVRFGPYVGEIVHNVNLASDSGYAWQIFKDNKPHHYVDARDPAKSNWLRYFNCARNEGEQNLLAFQYKGEIYYKTIQIIYPGQELLVFYGEGYAKELGIEAAKEVVQKKIHEKSFTISDTGAPEYRCPFCIISLAYKQPNVLMTHVAKKHLDTDPEEVRTLMKQLYGTNAKYQQCRVAEFQEAVSVGERDLKVKRMDGEDVDRHIERIGGSFRSKFCGEEFPSNVASKTHIGIHTGEKPFKCEHCGKGFTQSGDLQRHIRLHTGEKPFKCEHCGKGFNERSSLQTHIRLHTGEKPFKCEHCGKGFNERSSLQTHIRLHTGEKPFKCEHCGKGFNVRSNLQTHIRLHTGEKPFKCEHCGKGFNERSSLQTHIRLHTGEKPFKCEHCGKGFNVRSNLQRHIRLHTGEKPFKCEHCGKGFNERSHLQTHIRLHTGEKPFVCERCGKGFNQRSNLQKHIRIHTGEKPFKCEHCGKGFNERSNLQKHIRIHTGEKPFKCERCDKRFTENKSLKNHWTKCHTVEHQTVNEQ